ncbi:MAG: hemin uptake protein HemP [Zoogloeaceae bacterium]|nr:hemin uptake protein HemP [Zoogloeaceae bacterium]
MNSSSTRNDSEYGAELTQTICDDSPVHAEALSSVVLLRGHSSIAIDHLGTRYVLRATRAGKLILTK